MLSFYRKINRLTKPILHERWWMEKQMFSLRSIWGHIFCFFFHIKNYPSHEPLPLFKILILNLWDKNMTAECKAKVWGVQFPQIHWGFPKISFNRILKPLENLYSLHIQGWINGNWTWLCSISNWVTYP